MKNQKKLPGLFVLFACFILSLFLTVCDMSYIFDSDSSLSLTEQEREELEKSGRFLKLINMPVNTQISNVLSVQISNSTSSIAKINNSVSIKTFTELDNNSVTVYIPLIYNNNSEFNENGSFFVSFTIHVDAVTSFIVNASDRLLVAFNDGRGVFDINLLAASGSKNNSVIISEQEREELERTGRYLKLTNMPLNTQTSNIVSVQILNSASAIARLDRDSLIRIFIEKNSNTLYLPLVYNDGTEFIEYGSFFISFTIHIDALTSFIITPNDKILIQFIDGRGVLDIRTLPVSGSDNSSEIINVIERDELERTGRFLKLTDMPLNTQTSNIVSVQVSNSSAAVARLDRDTPIRIFIDDYSNTLYLPLVYNDGTEFIENGSFLISFTIHIDALTSYIVTTDYNIIVQFINGRGSFNINMIPDLYLPDTVISYFTIINLPHNTSIHNLSNIIIYNQVANIAVCSNNSLIEISINDNKASARIPLVYLNSSRSSFAETGSYYVSFDINIDALTRILVEREDCVQVYFTNGNGTIDAENIPVLSIPYLTISGLPLNISKHHFSNINIYSLAGAVANCRDYNTITINKESSKIEAVIPLSSASGNYFTDTGSFIVTFTIIIDAITQINYTRNDEIMLDFVRGSASLDLISGFGSFNAELVNPADTAAPIIKSGSSFDIDGRLHRITSNTPINSGLPTSSCVLYLYAYRLGNDVLYEYSSTAPVFNSSKNGWYNGSKRALWKMLYIVNNGSHFLFKTYIDNPWPHFNTFITSNGFTAGTIIYSLSGTNNPAPGSVTLQPGIYLLKLSGAAGGAGFGTTITTGTAIASGANITQVPAFPYAVNTTTTTPNSLGGPGGTITEIVTINTPTTFTTFTGSSGGDAPAPTFTSNNLTFRFQRAGTLSNNHGGGPATCGYIYGLVSGGSGGGGGSGTFIYSNTGYLLCAGGGGGGSGGGFLTPGGGGGAGGSIGSGSSGGAVGFIRQSYANNSSIFVSVSSGVGLGGGRSPGQSEIPSVLSSYGGSGAAAYTPFSNSISGVSADSPTTISMTTEASSPGGSAAYLVSIDFHNTNNANGHGASARALNSLIPMTSVTASQSGFTASFSSLPSLPGNPVDGNHGSSGGNNRNSVRGGGAGTGDSGSIIIYKLN